VTCRASGNQLLENNRKASSSGDAAKKREEARSISFSLSLFISKIQTLEIPFILVAWYDSVGPAHARVHASLRASPSTTHCVTRARKCGKNLISNVNAEAHAANVV